MSCEACRELLAFSDDPGVNRQRANRLDETFPECACERFSSSVLSTGTVDDGEILIRIVVSPRHINQKKGVPRASSFSDAETSGMSMLRDAQATNEQIRSLAEELVGRAKSADSKHPERAGVFGVFELRTGELRKFEREGEGRTAYCVYDTAEPGRECHVEAFQKEAGVADEIQQARRTELFDKLAKSFVPVSKFRGGLLADLAPVL